MKNNDCFKCQGKGVLVDKLDIDGGVVDCNVCSGSQGYLENSFEYKNHEYVTRNDDNYLEMI